MKTSGSKVDAKGRVIIPADFRDTLGIKIGEKILLEFDGQNQRIILLPAKKKLRKMVLRIADHPGSLARAASLLGRHKVDLLYTDSQSTKRTKEAVWNIIADFGRCDVKKLESALKKESHIKGCSITNF